LVYYISTEASPLERQLYSVQLNGKGRTLITHGEGTHSISMGPTAEYYLDTYSNLTSPSVKTLHIADGREWAVYREANRKQLEEYEFLPVEIVQVKASDGTLLYASMIKPPKFRADQKYPAIVMVYGGPHAQAVRNAWAGANRDQMLAHRGFVIWQLDNRGSSGRGHVFETPLFRRLGKTELADQLDGVRYLVNQGFVDPARIGIHGWSYGGFMTLYSLLNAPETFLAGLAGAPVTNWQNYDTIYTERYLGLPAANADGYRASSPVEYADKLKAKLLIVHDFEDDNVLFQNTMQIASALENANKRFEMVIYPQKTHGLSGGSQKHFLEETAEFFEKTLK
jgi:dipeptidyl-peptidase-4